MDVFKVRKVRESGSSSMGTLDSVHQDMVHTLRESKSKQVELRKEMDDLKVQIESVSSSNDMKDILQCSIWEARVRDLAQELSQLNPLEEYYMKNMDILTDYYRRDVGSASPAVQKEDSTFMKFFAAATPEGVSKKQIFDEYVTRMKLSNSSETGTVMTEHCNCLLYTSPSPRD